MSSKKKEDIYKDERFSQLFSNPRYRHMPQKENKVKIDSRFKGMFENSSFKVKYQVDKYGRQENKTSTDELKSYYDLSSEDDSSEEEEIKEQAGDENAIIEGGHEMPEGLKNKLKNLEVDYIRGEGILQSDSSDEESSGEEGDEIFIEHVWGELDHDAERTDDSSKRIACMHMDWDRIRAVDIMMLCNSFIPSGSGSILSVKIYPSEFGKERMAKEELQGPQELRKENETSTDDPVDEEDEAYREKLREYQLNRLKYYYAVIEFDSAQCADVVYKECDGLEYESTANRLDLRFIPDDMEFEDEPKDVCAELPDLAKYEPRIFFTTALQQAKVELTWDETDVGRTEISQKLFTDKRSEITDQDLRKFVACSSSSEGEEEIAASASENESDEEPSSVIKKSKDKINLYKSLLSEISQKEETKKKNQIEMEFSWGVGTDKKESKLSDSESDKEELTPFERILEKKKLKKKAKKAERKKKLKGDVKSDDDDDDAANQDGYSSEDFDDIDMNDPYFAEEFANDEFKMPKKSKKNKSLKNRTNVDDEEKLNAQKELELLLDDGEDEKAHFSLKKIQDNETMSSSKRKRRLKKSKKENGKSEPVDNFELNMKDDRFSAVFSQPEYNIDPTDPNFKKTKGMETLIHEKLKRRHPDDAANIQSVESQEACQKKSKTKDIQLNLLVKNIKRKAGK